MANSPRTELCSWFASPLGERLRAEQEPHLTAAARRFHGDTLLWAGCASDLTDSVRSCMVRNRLFTFCDGREERGASDGSDRSDGGPELARFDCELQAIPLPNNSLDAAVVHHGLDLAEDPRTAVRELSRVLAPGARLVVCGFNPMSLWGLRYAYARFFQDSFSGLRLVSPLRLQDWLTVLGFELCEEVRYLGYGLPFGVRTGAERSDRHGEDLRDNFQDNLEKPGNTWNPRAWSAGLKSALVSHNPPMGGVYIMSAVKQALGVRRDWSLSGPRNPKLAPVAYPKLSAWNRIERPD